MVKNLANVKLSGESFWVSGEEEQGSGKQFYASDTRIIQQKLHKWHGFEYSKNYLPRNHSQLGHQVEKEKAYT